MPRDRWNWLLVSFDQWRGDWWHQPWLQLPNLRRLARRADVLDRTYTSSPQCVPARASWLTGLTPRQLGVTSNQPFTMPADAPSFVRRLQAAGWHTELVGKTHWTPHSPGVDLRDNKPLLHALGFNRSLEIAGPRALAEVSCSLTDAWQRAGVLEAYRADLKRRYRHGCAHHSWPSVLPAHLYPDVWLANRAIERLQRQPDQQPWLLWLSFVGPHEPFDVPAPWRGRHTPDRLPPPQPRPLDAWHQAPRGTALRQLLERWPQGLPPDALVRLRADYADHLALLDDQLGRVLAVLDQRGDRRRTAIAVVSDHGELLGDWGLLLKGCFLEGAVRSLCMFRAPGARFGSVRREPHALTASLQAVAQSVCESSSGPWNAALEQARRTAVEVQFREERLILQGGNRIQLGPDGQPLAAGPA